MNNPLKNLIKEASSRLRDKLLRISIPSLDISAYNQKYVLKNIANIDYVLDIYTTILFHALNRYNFPLNKFVIVDYGGGSGIFSLLAKEAGIGTVIYNDIYDVSCKDINVLSKHLELSINHIVCGEITELKQYVKNKNINIHAVASFDVIEHIYDIESHFEQLVQLQKLPLRIIYGSGANTENYWKVRAITKIQKKDEFEIKENNWGHKERDALLPFIELRKNIISSYAPELGPTNIDFLAKSTRGLVKTDIENCVNEFLRTGYIKYQIKHPTNTCDPFTGNWSEHLIDLKWIQRFLEQIGFNVVVIPGKYYPQGGFVKRAFIFFFNIVISLFKRKGMFVSPYFIIIAQTK